MSIAIRRYTRNPQYTDGKRVLVQSGPHTGQPAIIIDEALYEGRVLCQLESGTTTFQAQPDVDITLWSAPTVDFSDIPPMEVVPPTKELPPLNTTNVEAVHEWLIANHCIRKDRAGDVLPTAHGRTTATQIIRQDTTSRTNFEKWLTGGLFPDAALIRVLVDYVMSAFERDDMRALDVFIVTGGQP